MTSPRHVTHISADFEEQDGWWGAKCDCGWSAPIVCPDAETAVDWLMQHAYEQGVLDGRDT